MTAKGWHQERRFSGGFGEKAQSHQRSSGQFSKSHYKLYRQQIEPLMLNGQYEKAEMILRLLAQDQSPPPEVFRDMAAICENRNEFDKATSWYQRWLSSPQCQPCHLLAQAQKAEELSWKDIALQRYLNFIEHHPTHQEALHRTSSLLLQSGRFREAMPIIMRMLEQEDPAVEAWINASWCFLELGLFDDASRWADLAFKSQPGHPIVLATKALLCHRDGSLKRASKLACRALSRSEKTLLWPAINRLLSRLFFEQGLLELSQSCLDVALKEEPLSAALHQLRGKILLLQGRLHEGFLELQWRQLPSSASSAKPSIPRHSQAVALVADCTLGDTLMFSRYAAWLNKRKNLNVKLFVRQPLVALMSHSLEGLASVHPIQGQERELTDDVQLMPLLSAPAEYGTCQEFPDLSTPCVHADPEIIKYWRQRLCLRPGEQLIGVNWCGSPMKAVNERHKSDFPLEALAALGALPNTRLVSLQKGFGSKQLLTCSFVGCFVANQQQVTIETRIEHMAAVMSLCDWIVSDDSGPAHLSGSLGIRSVVMLPCSANWRWGAAGNHSPWYPRTTLLRRRDDDQGWESLAEEASRLISASASRVY